MLRFFTGAALLCSLPALAAIDEHSSRTVDTLEDAHFGEAIFYARQGNYFDALRRMDAELIQHYGLDEPGKDSLHAHLGQAEFSVGDFELSYRMHHRAGRAIQAVLEGDVTDVVRNEAAYRLARIHFQKGQMQDALQALDRMHGEVAESVAESASFLRANVYLAIGRFDAASEILRDLHKAEHLQGFTSYNLGVALLRAGDQQGAYQQFAKAGTFAADEASEQAIRDKANLVLGNVLMDAGNADAAMVAFERIRLEGPFAEQALLGAGWANAAAGRFDRALVPWSMLIERNATQAAVQEAQLALPFAYGQLEVHGRAAVLYSQALDSFGGELSKLDASIASIEAGHFLTALAREEIRHSSDWVIRLRELPEAPETYYLTELSASHRFHNALQNYLDLEQLRAKLRGWQASFAAFDDLLQAREAYFQPLLPEVDEQFRALDSRMRLRQRQADLIEQRMHELLTMPRPEVLATADERAAHERLQSLMTQLEGRQDAQALHLRARIARLQGVLTWRLRTEYHQRLSALYRNVDKLRTALDALNTTYDSYVRTRQTASHSYQGFHQPFRRLAQRVDAALAEVNQLIASQGSMLERVAIAELKLRRSRLEEYQNVARYAMADSYDRATKLLQEAAR